MPIFGDAINTAADQAGQFEFAALPNSVYRLVVEVPGFRTHKIEVHTNGEDVAIGTVVMAIQPIEDPVVVVCPTFPPSYPWSEPDVRISPDADSSITGTVERNYGVPVPDVKVSMVSKQLSYSAKSTSQGEFRFSHVRPGLYRLIASAPGFADFVIDRIDVKAMSKTEILDPLVVHGCPQGVVCPVTKQVERDPDPACVPFLR